MVKKVTIGIVILVILIIIYNLLLQITNTLKSSDRLEAQADAVYKLEIKNKELKKKLADIQSPEFIEQQARDKLGLGKAGETVVIIPDEKLKSMLQASQAAEIRYPNWLGWWKVFFNN